MGRHLVRLTALAALALLLGGCGSTPAPAEQGISVRVDKDPFRITVIRDGRTLVAESEAARLRYRLAAGAEHRLTKLVSSSESPVGARTTYVVATDEPGRTALVSVEQQQIGKVVVAVALRPASGVQAVYDSFDTGPGDHFLGGGEVRDRVDLRGAVVPIKVSTDCGYAPMPFFSSTAGWALRLDTANVAGLAFPGSPGGGGCTFGTEPDCSFPALTDTAEVCVTGARLVEELIPGTLAETLAAFQAATPPAPVLPSLLELIKWRDKDDGPQQVLEDVTRLQAAGIPLGWVLLDNPWETCVGSLTFDRARILDPKGLIDEVHARGVRFMLWISPKILCNPGYPPGALVGDPADQVTIDLNWKTVVRAFELKLRRLVALGIDGVKADRGDEVDLEPLGLSYPNLYPVMYAGAVMRTLPPGDAAIFRAATEQSQRLIPGLWAGDQDGSFDGLREAIHAGLSASMSGFTMWGSDVGGYRSEQLTAEVFARWAQLGAVSPIMEVGGIGANATPWTLGPEAMSILKDAAILHYELFPYLHGVLQNQRPVLRPLGYAYPDDPEAWKAEYEFLVGPDLLAAPVIGPGTTPSVYLPQGSWIDLYTGERVTGGQVFTRETPLGQFPLYVREGAAVPFNLRTATGSWWGVDQQTHPGRAGWLTTNLARVDLSGQPRDVQIFVPASERPLHVTLGGRAVAWTWNPGPLPGVVVRLHGPTVRGRIVLSRT